MPNNQRNVFLGRGDTVIQNCRIVTKTTNGLVNCFNCLIFKPSFVVNILIFSCELPSGQHHRTSLMKSQHLQVMAWWHQAPMHYSSQYWPRHMSRYGVTASQWLKDGNMQAATGRVTLGNPWGKYRVALDNFFHTTLCRIIFMKIWLGNVFSRVASWLITIWCESYIYNNIT